MSQNFYTNGLSNYPVGCICWAPVGNITFNAYWKKDLGTTPINSIFLPFQGKYPVG